MATYIAPKSEAHFRMGGAALRQAAEKGDKNAKFEIERRAKNKLTKRGS